MKKVLLEILFSCRFLSVLYVVRKIFLNLPIPVLLISVISEIVFRSNRFPKLFVLKPLSFVILTSNLKGDLVPDDEDEE